MQQVRPIAEYYVASDKSFELFRTVSEPDVPTLRDVTDVQQTSAMLDWNLGGTVTVNSTVVFYIDASSTSSEESTTTISQLAGLTPGRTYRFYLRVTSFGKTAQSQNHTFITREFSINFSIIIELIFQEWKDAVRSDLVSIFLCRPRDQRSTHLTW